MADFLLELLTEEIPARMQARAIAQLVERFTAGTAAAALPVGQVGGFVTPRRLVLIAQDLAAAGAEVRDERRGPRVDAPEQAIVGFVKSTGLAREALEERDTPKGRFLYATIVTPGRSTAAVLAELIPAIVRDFDWPKSMRWGAASITTASPRWVRPMSGIVALLDDAVVPFDAAGVTSGRTTHGHRFMSRGPVEIASAATYADQLRAAYVMLDSAERAAVIVAGATAAADTAGLALIPDDGLIAENAGLTEWPVPLLGRFDAAFLDVPREVIQLTMRTNQKYFACTEGADAPGGALAPAFVCIANLEAADGGAGIVAGNRKVLAARLADAKFFWDADLARVRGDGDGPRGLESFTPKLKDIVFHEKLGTVADKVERVAKLARWLVESGAIALPSPLEGEGPVAPFGDQGEGARLNAAARSASLIEASLLPSPSPLPGASAPVPPPQGGRGESDYMAELAALAETAARLCKADLVSATVGEFPEVQGVAGGRLALAEGLDPRIAAAIRDHYKPVGPSDEVPTAPVTVAVALADKLDTLASFFVIDEMPTGSRDPFALRRATLGVIRLLFANNLHIRTRWLGEAWAQAAERRYVDVADALNMLTYFFVDRLKVQQRDEGVRHDIIDAVSSIGSGLPDRLDLLVSRAKALQAFLNTPDGGNLLAGYRRGTNIVRIEEGKEPGVSEGDVDSTLLTEPGEIALAAGIAAVEPEVAAAVAAEDFTGAMTALARLRPAVDTFFEHVTVNAHEQNLRRNRLALLARLRTTVHSVADFSKIEG